MAPPRTRIVAWLTSAASSGGSTCLVITRTPLGLPGSRGAPGNKKPRTGAGQGSDRTTDLLALYLTWRASRSAQITTEYCWVTPLPPACQARQCGGERGPISRGLWVLGDTSLTLSASA